MNESFCNASLQYASVLGVAELTGHRPALCLPLNDKPSDIRKYFSLEDFDECPPNVTLTDIREQHCATYDDQLVKRLKISCTINYRLREYLQSWKYFEHIKTKIKKKFLFREQIVFEAKRQLHHTVYELNDRINNATVLIGIHLRRGDFISYHNLGFRVLNVDFIWKAIKESRINAFRLVES